MPVIASANLTFVQASPGVYNYTITLNNDASSTTDLNSFLFAGVGTEGLMIQPPSVTGSPSRWTSQVITTPLGNSFAYGIQWSDVPGNFVQQIFPGQSSSAFTFTSTETPAQMAADTPVFTTQSIPTTESTVGFDGGDWPIIATVACFAAGTRIATAEGEIAVEDLHVGDRVRVVLGQGTQEVIWVGQRCVAFTRSPAPHKVWPVRISAGAFGACLPRRALFLSPDHAVYVDSTLIPVKYLINGSSIAQMPVDSVTYYHIELAEHDVLLAEGLPAESFLAMRDGSNYADRPGPRRLYPDFSARLWDAFGCARLVVTGPELEAARALVGRFVPEQAAA